MNKLLTIKQVTEYLKVSERTVLRYIESGRLQASRIGQWRIKESDLNKFLKDNLNSKDKKLKNSLF